MTSTTPDPIAASVVDLFCGAGGLSYGFKSQAFRLAGGIDIDESCRFAYERNTGAPFIRKDIGSVTAAEVNALFAPGDVRVLVGCAPCQPFSTYNQKNEDPNWRLLESFGRLIDEVRPDVVSMENVPRLLAFKGGSTFEAFVTTLRDADYRVCWSVLYCPDYGLAQTRSRLVLLASRLGDIDLPAATHNGRHRTVRDEIGSLRPLTHGEADESDPLHRTSRLSPVNVSRIESSKPGGSWRDWDAELVADCHKAASGKGYSSVYGRMEWSSPAPTITTQFYGFGNGRFGHPDQDRGLSLREGALLQGFPPDYEFVAPGGRIHFTRVGQMIGNAVPVPLATAIATSIRAHVENVA